MKPPFVQHTKHMRKPQITQPMCLHRWGRKKAKISVSHNQSLTLDSMPLLQAFKINWTNFNLFPVCCTLTPHIRKRLGSGEKFFLYLCSPKTIWWYSLCINDHFQQTAICIRNRAKKAFSFRLMSLKKGGAGKQKTDNRWWWSNSDKGRDSHSFV